MQCFHLIREMISFAGVNSIDILHLDFLNGLLNFHHLLGLSHLPAQSQLKRPPDFVVEATTAILGYARERERFIADGYRCGGFTQTVLHLLQSFEIGIVGLGGHLACFKSLLGSSDVVL